ncbi:hypothetical protein [Amycolatopsis sp. NPDC051071]|uniref:hypothetical protein n=1 Tax=Amycolatopsis sp. NPDC051071 TaxID=3154637 RepID=UPI0034246DA1
MVAAAPAANAQIKSTCNGTVCFAADVYYQAGDNNVLVSTGTVSFTDGIKRYPNIFVARDHWSGTTRVLSWKKSINKKYPKGTLACGDQVSGTAAACVTL